MSQVSNFFLTPHFRMSEVLHPHPRYDDPHPGHYAREDHQRRIIPDDGKSRVIFQLWRRVGRLAHVPGPAPYAQAGTHADDEDDPCCGQQGPAPGACLGVVVRWERGRKREREGGDREGGKWRFGRGGGTSAWEGREEVAFFIFVGGWFGGVGDFFVVGCGWGDCGGLERDGGNGGEWQCGGDGGSRIGGVLV